LDPMDNRKIVNLKITTAARQVFKIEAARRGTSVVKLMDDIATELQETESGRRERVRPGDRP